MDCLVCVLVVFEEKVNFCFLSVMIIEDEVDKVFVDDMINFCKEWNNCVVDEFSDKVLLV